MNQEHGQQFIKHLLVVRHDLPFSPQLLKTLFAQTADGSRTMSADLAKTISQDQGLSIRILSMANSAYYGLQAQVASVERAVAVLGVREIRNMALALAAQSLTTRTPPPPEFDLPGAWLHQLAVAATAKAMCRLLPRHGTSDALGDDMFAAGLLHDVGKLLTAIHAPEDWRAIMARCQVNEVCYIEAEEAHWGLDHGVIGALLLRSWNLPEMLVEPINWHHFPESCPHWQLLATLLAAADGLVGAVAGGRPVDSSTATRLAELPLDPDDARKAAHDAYDNPALRTLMQIIVTPARTR